MRIFVASALFVLVACFAWAGDQPRTATITAMGGIPINISAWGLEADIFDAAVEAISDRIELEEALLSTYRETSAISRINRGEELARTPPSVTELVELSLAISAETAGAFDITVKPLVELWRTARKQQVLPTEQERNAALARVGYKDMALDPDGSVAFGKDGMMLDLGGIAKGYFADIAVLRLREAGAQRCLVDIGGDITAWQASPDTAQPFRVGIRDPHGGQELLAVLEVPTGAVVTSGNYERFYEIDGKRYCHIFDPRTGQPVEGMLSVTLLAPTGLEADALATGVFVMGAKAGAAFVEQRAGTEAVIISEAPGGGMDVYISPGLVDTIEFNTD
jgi:thiamine biosynthesis lipoprotein